MSSPSGSMKGRMDLLMALARGELGVQSARPQITRRGQREAPLSFAQQRLWFIDQLEPGNPIYNIPGALKLVGALDEAALRSALSEIACRHEVLRTTFATVDGSPVQKIHDPAPCALPVVDLSDLSQNERDKEVARLLNEDKNSSFNLANGPLIRTGLLRVGSDEHILLLTMHHIIADAWSRGRLFRELALLYEAFRVGQSSSLPELPVQYADYAAWQREWLAGDTLAQQISYWKNELAGAPPLLELATDRPRETAVGYEGDLERFVVSPDVCSRLRALCKEESATLFMVLSAAFSVVMHRYTNQHDIVLGTDEAGRHHKETEPLIGFFINHLVLRTDTSGNPSFRELLRRVREKTLGAFAHQEVPFDKLVEEMRPERKTSHTPLFQVLLVMLPPGGELQFDPSLDASFVNVGIENCKYEMTIFMKERQDDILVGWLYRTALFDRTTIQAMAKDFSVVVEKIAGNSETTVGEFRALLLDLSVSRSAAEQEERREANRARLRGCLGAGRRV